MKPHKSKFRSTLLGVSAYRPGAEDEREHVEPEPESPSRDAPRPPPPPRRADGNRAPPPATKTADARPAARSPSAPTAGASGEPEHVKPAASAIAPAMGTMLTPEIRLERHVGRSSSGVAWIVDHKSSGGKALLEFVDERIVARTPQDLERFEKEIKAAARVHSEHLPRILGHGVTREGMPYVVRELLGGERLGERIDRAGRLGLEQSRQLIVQVATALASAHEQNVIHGDINPQRIWLCPSDRGLHVKLLDLGTAKPALLPRVAGLCSPGWLIGTPEFMSPELVHGTGPIDRRADLWALGVLAYVALTARAPFDGQTLAELFSRIGNSDPVSPSSLQPSLPEALDEWFAVTLHRDPTHRFTSAEELAFAFVEAASRPGDAQVPSVPAAREAERARPLPDRPEAGPASDRPAAAAQAAEDAASSDPGIITIDEDGGAESFAPSEPRAGSPRPARPRPSASNWARSRALPALALVVLAAIATVLVFDLVVGRTSRPDRAAAGRSDGVTAAPTSLAPSAPELAQAPDSASPVGSEPPSTTASAPTAAPSTEEAAPETTSSRVSAKPVTTRSVPRTTSGSTKPGVSTPKGGAKKTPPPVTTSGLKRPSFD